MRFIVLVACLVAGGTALGQPTACYESGRPEEVENDPYAPCSGVTIVASFTDCESRCCYDECTVVFVVTYSGIADRRVRARAWNTALSGVPWYSDPINLPGNINPDYVPGANYYVEVDIAGRCHDQTCARIEVFDEGLDLWVSCAQSVWCRECGDDPCIKGAAEDDDPFGCDWAFDTLAPVTEETSSILLGRKEV